MTLNVSEPAQNEIKRIVESQDHGPEGGLRLYVRGGGCAGMEYGMDFVSEPAPQDKTFDFEGARLYIDPKSYLFLQGTMVDFKESLMGRGFVFENPNAKSSCGCGTSFSV